MKKILTILISLAIAYGVGAFAGCADKNDTSPAYEDDGWTGNY